MSTLISDLDGAPAQGDGDFVQNILNEMNGGGPPPPMIQGPPAIGSQAPQQIIQAPNPNTIAPRVMDNGPATAHVIGGSQPTPADFAQMMSSGGGVMAAPQNVGGLGGAGAAAYVPQAAQQPYVPRQKKSWFSRSLDEFRTPLLVSILVFVFSLPVVNFLFAHYVPSLTKGTGELTMIGLAAKSLAAGVAFVVLQRVVVPLLSS